MACRGTTALLVVAAFLPITMVAPLGAPVGDDSNSDSAMPRITLQATAFSNLPNWESDDHLAALKTFWRSCETLLEAAEGSDEKAQKAAKFKDVCKAAMALANEQPDQAAAKTFFETHFTPHEVVHRAGEGLLTGYYEPALEGSRERTDRFQIPIYRRPPDLVNVVAETERGAKGERYTHMRKTDKGVVPYPTRAEIEKGALADQGLELLYLADPVDTFFMHIQGSGRIKLTDGTTIRIGYDGKNGHPYSSIGRYLIDKGELGAETMSLQKLAEWLRTDPKRGRDVMWKNASFIFFRELEGKDAEGPVGAMSVPLTPGRSLAVDTSYHALGTPIYVDAPSLKHATETGGFHRLMIAQDVGSAIKGPERGDIYFGSGKQAGELAGVTKNAGSFFVLLPASD